MPARAHAPRQSGAGRQQPLCRGGAPQAPACRRQLTGTARISTSTQAAAQAQQPEAAPHCKAAYEAAREAKPAARCGGLRPGAAPPSAWDARGIAVYAAFLAAAGAYFWLRAEGVCAMGPYAWCAPCRPFAKGFPFVRWVAACRVAERSRNVAAACP